MGSSKVGLTVSDPRFALLDEINLARKKNMVPSVMIDERLTCAAKKHSEDLLRNNLCSHFGSDKSSPWDRSKTCGTTGRGEIIVCGTRKPQRAVSAWLESPGHRKILLDPQNTQVGISNDGPIWVALFR